METTREQILRFVNGHREATVLQLAETMSLSPQAVRRHLDGLRADGLVDVRLERHGVGRPAAIFFATEAGAETSGRTYLQLLSRLMRHVDPQVIDGVFAGIAIEVAADHASEVKGATLHERVAQVSKALEREGIVDEWANDDGTYHLLNNECPYLRLAEMSEAPCHADKRSIELLVGSGADVEQTSRIVDGSTVCEYVIRPATIALEEVK
ncbi:MAG TPA: helix-turn-helix domain-containing protein [Dehalococcoidia bacterium]|nr:helix-turn-helix domain-containing protein [Dehalococcoidia bacterium]